MEIKKNAREALKYWKDGIFDFKTAPKWVKGIVEAYIPTDSIHLWYDDPIQKDIVALLRDIAEGDIAKYRNDSLNERLLNRFLAYLNQEVKTHTCQVCGKEYEAFDQDNGYCSMQCMNAKDFLGVTDIADILGWTKAKVSEYHRNGYLGFPKPVTYIGGRPVWRREQIEAFKAKLEDRA